MVHFRSREKQPSCPAVVSRADPLVELVVDPHPGTEPRKGVDFLRLV